MRGQKPVRSSGGPGRKRDPGESRTENDTPDKESDESDGFYSTDTSHPPLLLPTCNPVVNLIR